MSALALVGGATLVFAEETLEELLLPLVALAAGTMLGGAFFHMIPIGIEEMSTHFGVFLWVTLGFVVFLSLEQFLHWHHCHNVPSDHRQPLGSLLLVADGLHNLIGGLAVGGAFVVDIGAGIAAWSAAAAHEIPQELGDFGVLVHGGWSTRKALIFNFLSALTFLVGGLLAWGMARSIDTAFLVPFAAGNFIYIAAADLIPEVKHHEDWRSNILHFGSFLVGLGLLAAVRIVVKGV